MVCTSKDSAVAKSVLCTYKRHAASNLEEVHIYTLAPQYQGCACFHFCHELYGMPSYCKSIHCYCKTAVGCSTPCYRSTIGLHSVDIEEHRLCSGTLNSIWHDNIVRMQIAAIYDSVAQAVTACQTQIDHADTHIGLLALRVATGRVGCRCPYIDVGRTNL